MPDISKIQLEDTTYDIKDSIARNSFNEINNKINNKIIIAIGDSWTSNTNDTSIWKTLISEAYNYQIKNYSKSGCGFIAGDKPFIDQAREAVADTSYNHSNVDYIIVIGGVNDIIYQSANYSTLINPVRSLFEYLQNNFKCKILFIPNYKYPYNRQSVIWKSISEAINENNLALMCDIVPYQSVDDFGEDKFHLTLNGQKLLASNIAKCMFGGLLTRKSYNLSSSGDGGLWFHITQYIDNGIVHLAIYGDFNNSETEVINHITLPKELPFKFIDGHNLVSNYSEIKEYSPVPFIEFKLTDNDKLVILQHGNSGNETKNSFHINVMYDCSNIQTDN